ncbi:MAG: hypothetical protein IKI11_06955 [Neisseriaceae bacterium]|nr:hypothetical protein [Neisseriaceae bacterium]
MLVFCYCVPFSYSLFNLNTLSGYLKIKNPFSIARRLPHRDFITARNDSCGSGCLKIKNSFPITRRLPRLAGVATTERKFSLAMAYAVSDKSPTPTPARNDEFPAREVLSGCLKLFIPPQTP